MTKDSPLKTKTKKKKRSTLIKQRERGLVTFSTHDSKGAIGPRRYRVWKEEDKCASSEQARAWSAKYL